MDKQVSRLALKRSPADFPCLALHYSASKNHEQVTKTLLAHKADACTQDADGATPLHRASALGHTATVKLLLASAPGTAKTLDKQHNTPLHLALAEDHAQVALLLMAAGASPNALNKDGKAPIDLASTQTLQFLADNKPQ